MIDITLAPLKNDDREQFIQDNQEAFNYGALEEFGQRDDHFEEDDQIISRETIETSINSGEAYRIVQDGKPVGGIIIKVEGDNFAEMVFPFAEDFDTFCQTARQVIALAASTDPYEQADTMTDYNVILVSALPRWNFTSLCNTQRNPWGNDYPLCVIGKMGDDKTMPVSITVHHGFADGEHIFH